MLLWRLRQGLNDPLRQSASAWRSYIALTTYQQHAEEKTRFKFGLSPVTNALRGLGLVVLPIGAILFGAPVLILLLFILFTWAPLLVPLFNSIYGIMITFNVSGQIARERQKGTYDVLNTLPLGKVGLHWMYTILWLRDHRLYRNLALGMVSMGIIAAIFNAGRLFGSLGSNNVTIPYWIISSTSVIGILIFDHLGTQVNAGLISMISPAYTPHVGSARMGAVGAFVGLQIAAYSVGFLTVGIIMPAIYRFIGANNLLYADSLPVMLLIAFVGFRELTIRLLWRILRSALNATPAELDALC